MQFLEKHSICLGMLTLCVVLFAMPLSISAQTVVMPDKQLRAAINEVLDKNPNARITVAELSTLRELRVNDMGIRNLTGLEAAVRLESLSIRDNSISDLSPLADLTNLETLGISGNLVQNLSTLKELVNLRYLDLTGNLITDLSPLAGLVRIEIIDTSVNPPIDLSPLSGLINLREFRSWGTTILDFSALAELPKLVEIDICGGDLSDISPLEGLTGLAELYLAGNDITDISPLASLTGLTRLSVHDNQVSDLSPLEELTGLRWIDLYGNTIADVSPLGKLENLTWLDLGKNEIVDVSALSALPNLTWLGLAANEQVNASQLERFSTKTSIAYSDFVSLPLPEVGPKIQGPWLWAIMPGAGVSNVDLLEQVSKGGATEVKVATFGATEDKPIGNGKWKAHKLSPTGGDNLNEMTDALGWGSGSDIYAHVVYGSVTLNAPRRQETTMLVGSSDGVKVWLNGEVVHYNPVERHASDFQDAFPVTLKKGANVLLVAVDNRDRGSFSGFFGFAKDADYQVNPIGKKIIVKLPAWDVNKDGRTDILDLIMVGQDFGKAKAANTHTDVNKDGKRNIADLVLVAQHLDEISGVAAAPSLRVLNNLKLDPAIVSAWIAQAQRENDGSLAFQHGIANLQRVLMVLVPKNTTLLANYPNPFNPETWIPYQLAEPAKVIVRIYSVKGGLIRTLAMGHQPAGDYRSRSRAVYWDGKNEIGEPVASGVYFYTLTAGDFKATRKMLIRK